MKTHMDKKKKKVNIGGGKAMVVHISWWDLDECLLYLKTDRVMWLVSSTRWQHSVPVWDYKNKGTRQIETMPKCIFAPADV